MKRRSLLKALCTIGLGTTASRLNAKGITPSKKIIFYIAGVRYQKPPSETVKHGDQVLIKPEIFRGKPCYTVYTSGLIRLGYVPRKLIDTIQPASQITGLLTSARKHALPWKRYKVEVITIV